MRMISSTYSPFLNVDDMVHNSPFLNVDDMVRVFPEQFPLSVGPLVPGLLQNGGQLQQITPVRWG